jgi:hypothetical protein
MNINRMCEAWASEQLRRNDEREEQREKFDEQREHERDLEYESRVDDESWNVDPSEEAYD